MGGGRHQLELALRDGRPLKGAPKVLAACRDDLTDLVADGRTVIAVFDDDKIRSLLQLPPGASDERVEQAIRAAPSASGALVIVLLKRNLESVIAAVRHCAPELDPARVERALKHKDLLARDTVLIAVSRAAMQRVRACILEQVPSLQTLVDRIVTALAQDRRPRRRR
jgi:hypothetical protein